MKRVDDHFGDREGLGGETYLLMSLLPPPISLDTLCLITGRPPVRILQSAEQLVHSGHLSRYTEKGVGYYHLSDFRAAQDHLKQLPQATVLDIAERAVAAVCDHLPDGAKKWLHLAHIYQISGLPVRHSKDLIRAGHYCLERNMPVDAAAYYRMALKAMAAVELDPSEQRDFIDATIGLCTCRDTELSKIIQRKFLTQALEFCGPVEDPVRMVRLRVLIAKTFIKTARSDEAAKHLDLAWKMLANHDLPNDIRIQVALANSELLFWQGFIDKAIERYESVLGNHEELPPDVETLKSSIRLGWTYGLAGETARAVGLIRAVRRKARELDAPDLERYASLILVVVLAEAGRIKEGEAFLEEIFNLPEALLDPYTLWPGNGKRAYFAYCRGEYEKAFEYQKQAYENSKALGTPHHRGPDNLEIMLGLEERGLVHPEWNFEADTKRLLSWPDIYMQGVAHRFLALKKFKQNGPLSEIKADLKSSISLLTRAGAKIELSHAKILLARIRIREERSSAAEKLLKSAWEVLAKVNPNLFPKDLKPYLDRSSKNALWVASLLSVGDALSSLRSRDALLRQIVKQAMRIAGAERGAIFLRQEQALKMVASRNIEAAEISSAAFADRMELIQTVFDAGAETVRNQGICNPEGAGSPGAAGWTAVFPVRLKARVLGVIFMDSELAGMPLPEDEISLLRIISNQAAVALENMEAYEEIIDLNSYLEAETQFYREAIEQGPLATQMIGRSEPFKKMLNLINQVAPSDTTVMITGETGVGKDLVAQTLHQNSNRAAGPFIPVNVVSLSPELIASELFGHEKGAFTGASQTRKGRFELAGEGTLFLDDIDAFSLDIQAKMLRVLETKEFERVGGTRTLKTRFRLVAASNRNIEELVERGLFRSDFYYRLNVFPIHIPPLRERSEDIPALARYFMRMFGKKFGKRFDTISKRDLQTLIDYHWPGNIRELRHVIERAVLLSRSGRLVIPPLASSHPAICGENEKILPLRKMEARHIIKALSRCRGKVSGKGGAAELLEVKPTTLYSMMKRLGIERDAYRIKRSDR
jgi:transcriptional regulator with GAF, ATPase, and Fis domain